MRKITYRCVLTMIVLLSSVGFSQSMVQISAAKDNTLYEDPNGTLSNGAGDYLFTGKTSNGFLRRALLKFDIGAVPAGAVIDSVKLTLYMSRTLLTNNESIELHRVLSDWGEGTSNAVGNEGGGAPAAPGDASWIHTFFDTQFWTNSGGDLASTVAASLTVGDTAFYTWGSTPQMVADVQDWLDNPANNFGWVIISDETANTTTKRFDSRDNPIASHQPRLIVFYTPPTTIGGLNPNLIKESRLFQNYPNPFNPSTTIEFELPASQFVTLTVYNILGSEIATLINEAMPAGEHTITFDANGLPAGLYLYELRASDFKETKRMTLLK